ncbi:MAG: GAF domain-containing protein [Acidobacteriota bacterium]
MMRKATFDLRDWHNQMMAEKERLESELSRISKLLEALSSFVAEEEMRKPRTQNLVPAELLDGEFEQLSTLNKKIQLLYFLLEVIRTFSTETDSERLHSLIIEKSAQLIDADRSALFLLDTETNQLSAKVLERQGLKETPFPNGIGLVGYVASTGKTINIFDVEKDPRFNPDIDEKPVYQAKNVVLTPLRDTTGNIFGVLEVFNKNEGRFTADDEHLLQAFAAQASMALKGVPQLLDSSLPISDTMLLIMKALSGGLDTDSLLQSLMKKTTQVMNADRSTLFLIDFDKQELWSKVAEGSGISEIRFPLGRGIAGHVASTGETVNIPDAYKDPRFNQEIDTQTGYQTRTILCAPLRDENGKITGALQVLNKKTGSFTAHDEKLICAFASQASKVLKSARFLLNLITILEAEKIATAK